MSNRQVELAPHPKTRGLTLLVDDETALLKAYGVERGPTKQRDMRRLTAVCREFETQVIAQGVGTPDERERLVVLGCDKRQGHLFSALGIFCPEVKFALRSLIGLVPLLSQPGRAPAASLAEGAN